MFRHRKQQGDGLKHLCWVYRVLLPLSVHRKRVGVRGFFSSCRKTLTLTLFYEVPVLVKSRLEFSCRIFGISAARVLMHGSRTPPPSHLVAELFAEMGAVKVDRPEGGDPMYSWGGTLTAPSSAYNPASRWEGGISSPPAVLRRHYFFLAACHAASIVCAASRFCQSESRWRAHSSMRAFPRTLRWDSPCGLSEGPCRLPYLPAGFKPKRVTSSPARTQAASGTFTWLTQCAVYSFIAILAASCHLSARRCFAWRHSA